LENARLEGEARIEQLQEEILELRRRLARAGQPLEVVEHISTKAVTLEGEFKEPIAVTKVDDASTVSELRLGDRVHIRSIDTIGVITELGAENAEVQVGRLRIRAKIDELAHPGEAEAQGGKVSSDLRNGVRIRSLSYDAPPLELDIRGRTIEGALEELEKRLDAAFLAGMPFVRIIHGKGTGKLRQAVRQELKNNAYVSSFEPGHQSEGGDGVTRVKLAIS
jgi:DNA mismatch repair protein MutS2